MIKKYSIGSENLTLRSDIAASEPVYVYFSKEQNKLLYSKFLVELLDSPEVKKPLKVSDEGISFLLQSGVVPPPKTVYQDVYILGIGDEAKVSDDNGKITIEFSFNFPFLNFIRKESDDYDVSYSKIQELLLNATLKDLDASKETFIFHSAGKDSNPLVIAIAEAGLQDKFTLVTHKTKRKEDESSVSSAIAKVLGFKHIVLNEVDQLCTSHIEEVNKLFKKAPLPCTNNISILYPLYVAQLPALQNSNIVDGSGSDIYIGHVPGETEFKRQKLAKYFSHFKILGECLASTNRIYSLTKTRAELTGLNGFSAHDSRKLFRRHTDISSYWRNVENFDDYLDFRASVRGRVIDTELFMRKARNFCDAFGNNMVFPWTDQKVVEHFMYMPERYLIDRKGLRNKLLLREMLKDKLDVDSDEVGKRGYPYDLRSMLVNNHAYIVETITDCKLWNSERGAQFIQELSSNSTKGGRVGLVSSSLLYQLFMISGWHNRCRWLH